MELTASFKYRRRSPLAKFYSMLANGGALDGQHFFSRETLRWMTTTLADGIDCVFQIPTAFSAGKILFHACKWRRARRTTFLFARNFAVDDDNAGRWN